MNSTTVLFSLTRSGSVPNQEIGNEGSELTQTKTSRILIHTSLVPNLPIGNANNNRQKVYRSLSYKVNLAYIMNSTTGSIFSN